jgi:hypothetical protein
VIEVFFNARGPFVFIVAGARGLECFIVALLFPQNPESHAMGEGAYGRAALYAGKLADSCLEAAIVVPQLRFGITEARSFPTESSTPLMNWTDSGAENLRAISSASLITTGRGV